MRSFPPAYAEIFESWWDKKDGSFEAIGTDLDQSYHVTILQTQSLLMDKIDWNNCAIAHKATRSYVYMNNPDDEWFQPYQLQTAYTYNDLVEYCGEIP